MPLFWRLFLANAATLTIAFGLLAAGAPEALGSHGIGTLLLAGAALMLVNAAVIGHSLSGLGDLTSALAAGGGHVALPEGAPAEIDQVVAAYGSMREQHERERTLTARAALRAQEAERRSIARDLHDEVGQNLTFMLLRLKGLAEHAPEELSDDVAAISEATRFTLDQVRSLSRQLRPGVLEDLGLRPALAALVDELVGAGIDAKLECPPGLGRAPERDIVIYRVVQEALTNIVRHADATTVRVVVAPDEEWVRVTVSDDGSGVPGREGTGTASMRERARLVGGTFSRTSTPGTGTEVLLTVPLLIPGDSDGTPTYPIPTISLRPLLKGQV